MIKTICNKVHLCAFYSECSHGRALHYHDYRCDDYCEQINAPKGTCFKTEEELEEYIVEHFEVFL